MLRVLVAVLLVANLAFWAWSAGTFEGLGLGPTRERDPARLAQQLHPQAVRVLPLNPAASAATAAPAASAVAGSPLQCLEAGPFATGALDAAERVLVTAGWAEGSWVRSGHDAAALYAVLLGPYGNRDALQKKREELGRLRVTAEALDLPGEGAGGALQPGFVLGRFDSRGAAESALAAFNQRGVRTARVALLRPAGSETRLRVESATAAQAERLRAISDAALGSGFGPCAPAVATAAAR